MAGRYRYRVLLDPMRGTDGRGQAWASLLSP